MDTSKTGSFIAEKRKEKGLSQAQLAKQLNVSDRAVSKWENSRSFPDPSNIEQLCRILDISVDELYAGKKLPKQEDITVSKKPDRKALLIIGAVSLFLMILSMLFYSKDGYYINGDFYTRQADGSYASKGNRWIVVIKKEQDLSEYEWIYEGRLVYSDHSKDEYKNHVLLEYDEDHLDITFNERKIHSYVFQKEGMYHLKDEENEVLGASSRFYDSTVGGYLSRLSEQFYRLDNGISENRNDLSLSVFGVVCFFLSVLGLIYPEWSFYLGNRFRLKRSQLSEDGIALFRMACLISLALSFRLLFMIT